MTPPSRASSSRGHSIALEAVVLYSSDIFATSCLRCPHSYIAPSSCLELLLAIAFPSCWGQELEAFPVSSCKYLGAYQVRCRTSIWPIGTLLAIKMAARLICSNRVLCCHLALAASSFDLDRERSNGQIWCCKYLIHYYLTYFYPIWPIFRPIWWYLCVDDLSVLMMVWWCSRWWGCDVSVLGYDGVIDVVCCHVDVLCCSKMMARGVIRVWSLGFELLRQLCILSNDDRHGGEWCSIKMDRHQR